MACENRDAGMLEPQQKGPLPQGCMDWAPMPPNGIDGSGYSIQHGSCVYKSGAIGW